MYILFVSSSNHFFDPQLNTYKIWYISVRVRVRVRVLEVFFRVRVRVLEIFFRVRVTQTGNSSSSRYVTGPLKPPPYMQVV
jgi:hypothetical protein